MEPVGHISHPEIEESSGLVESRQWPGLFWTHNDSGDSARVFPIDAEGKTVLSEGEKESKHRGVAIEGAANVDWEDIAADNDGNLYIAACGNNANMRRDLGVYVVREPHPLVADKAMAVRWIEFGYPDQEAFPPAAMNFDCESLFWANGKLYFATKHRSDTRSKLYRMDAMEPGVRNPLTLLGEADVRGMATAADATRDGSAMVLLTYDAIWLFEKPDDSDNYFAGKTRWLPIAGAKQCEGVCFVDNGQALLLSNEQRDLFRVPVADLIPLEDADSAPSR